MNRIELVEKAAALMQTALFDTSPKCHLCLWHGSLYCDNATHTTLIHPIFLTFEASTLTLGLSAREWDQLGTRLWNVFKEKI